MSDNPRKRNNTRRKKLRDRIKALGLPCAICGRPIDYSAPSDSFHPNSYVLDEIHPVSRYREFGYSSATEAALDPNNVQPCHYACNLRKSNKTMEELKRMNLFAQTIYLPDGEW